MTAKYRNALPQLNGELYLADAGMETDLIFNKGVPIREFASHTLLPEAGGRAALKDYFRDFFQLAAKHNTGFIIDAPTWKAHMHWAADLKASENDLRQANRDAVAFATQIRDELGGGNQKPILLNAVIGPKGDAYAPEDLVTPEEAQAYHAQQIGWLAATDVDMVTAMTFTQSGEAIGIVRAAASAGLPIVVSFTVETDGRLPSGQSLKDAIEAVDAATDNGPAYFMVNCAHPDHFADVLEGDDWARRIRGIRCNASRMSHAELDCCETLDDGDPQELAAQNLALSRKMPWLNVFGGCCGSDFRHVNEIATALAA